MNFWLVLAICVGVPCAGLPAIKAIERAVINRMRSRFIVEMRSLGVLEREAERRWERVRGGNDG